MLNFKCWLSFLKAVLANLIICCEGGYHFRAILFDKGEPEVSTSICFELLRAIRETKMKDV